MKSIAGGWDNGFMLSNSIADGNRPYSSRSVISFGIYFTVKHLLNLVKGYAEFMNMLKLSSLMRLFAKNCWRSKAKRWGFDLALPSQTLIELVIKLIVWWTFKTVYSIQMQYFHGNQKSANQALRAMALLWNFHPYCQKIQRDCLSTRSPFRDLNGFSYHNHWLRNLLIASSLNGRGIGRFLEHKLI